MYVLKHSNPFNVIRLLLWLPVTLYEDISLMISASANTLL